jgi:hypothetical protein
MCEGYVWTVEQRERLREASLKREGTIRQKVSVGGVVYNNYSQAAAATGISPRSIRRYAIEGVKPQSGRNRKLAPELLAIAKTITFVETSHETEIKTFGPSSSMVV